MIVNSAVLFADGQATLSNSESGLQMSVHSLDRVYKDFGLEIFTVKTNVIVLHGADPIPAKPIVDGTDLEHVSIF